MPVLIGAPYMFVGIAFAKGRTWASVVMAILMAIAGLVFAQGMLMAACLGHPILFWWTLAGFCCAAYTGGFMLYTGVTQCRDDW